MFESKKRNQRTVVQHHVRVSRQIADVKGVSIHRPDWGSRVVR